MGALRIFLRTGEELSLPRSLEELIDAKPRLKKLHGHLEERYRRAGNKNPAERANAEVENLLRAAFTDFADAFILPKKAALERLIKLQDEVISIYDDVLRSRSKDVKIDVPALHAKYKEMQALFSELSKPATKVADEAGNAGTRAAAGKILTKPTALPEGAIIVHPSTRLNSLVGRRGWTPLAGGGMHAKLKSGTVDLRVVNNIIEVTSTPTGKPPVLFKEFDTLATPYGTKPKSTRVIQAHHACQDALMKRVFGKFGYEGDQAPTIWMRDSTGDSPHGVITHAIQNPQLETRAATQGLSYGMIRDWAVADLKAAGASDTAIREYLSVMDRYFEAKIEPRLKSAGRLHLKGTITAH
jgi:hypothetical protein